MSKSAALRDVKRAKLARDVKRQTRAELLPWETLLITPREAAHLAARMERKARLAARR